MFFTNAGRVIAWLCLVGGLAHFGYLMVYAVENGPPLAGDPKWDKFWSSTRNDYQVIAFGIVLGILTEISRSVAKRDA